MSSKFKGIFDRSEPPEPVVAPEPMPSPAPIVPPKRGRPPGKRSNPTFVQVTAYVPDDLHHNIKMALLSDRKKQEFSELVGDLLRDWFNARS